MFIIGCKCPSAHQEGFTFLGLFARLTDILLVAFCFFQFFPRYTFKSDWYISKLVIRSSV
jgi:hypothetical protein